MFEFEKHNIMILNNTLGECEKRYNNIRSAYVYKKRGIISLCGGIPSLLSSLIIPWQPYINIGAA